MEIKSGFCQCGCGDKTNIAAYTDNRRPCVKGQPVNFLKGHQNRKGGETIHSAGHKMIRCPDHHKKKIGKYVFEHTLLTEKVLGKPLPPKAVVHHYTPDQLVVCENQAYHLLLHQRTTAKNECGHASWRKCNYYKKWDDPKNLRIYKVNVCHAECANSRAAYYRKLKKETAGDNQAHA